MTFVYFYWIHIHVFRSVIVLSDFATEYYFQILKQTEAKETALSLSRPNNHIDDNCNS